MKTEVKVKVKGYIEVSEMWKKALKMARATVGKEDLNKEPSEKFKRNILKSQHSPIRKLKFEVDFKDIHSHVTQQFSRHHIAIESDPYAFFSEEIKSTDIEHFVKTSRANRTGIKRSERRQDDLVDYSFEANAQGLIDASKKRLCRASDPLAVKHWNSVKKGIAEIEPLLSEKMQPQCIHCGFCPEDPDLIKCGYLQTSHYKKNRVLFKGE